MLAVTTLRAMVSFLDRHQLEYRNGKSRSGTTGAAACQSGIGLATSATR